MIAVGGIYRAVPAASGGPAALVLATGLDEAARSVALTLLSPDVEFGGSADLVLSREDSGLGYSLLVQSDIFGYARMAQLDRAVARVSHGLLEALARVQDDDCRLGYPVAGPPVLDRSDPRWTFKLYELRRLQALTA